MEKFFALFFIVFTAAMIVLFGVLSEYNVPADRQLRYPHFQDIHVMLFIGFAFALTYMARSGFTSTCHAFVAAAYAVLWALLCRGFWQRAVAEHRVWDKLKLDVVQLISADFAAVTVLITFGALLGRVTASQLLMLAIIEVLIFAINEAVLDRIGTKDVGGSMKFHVFGAFFGVFVSLVLERARPAKNVVLTVRTSRVTDTMALVGTLFLFCYFPSFNSALADPSAMDRAVVNTYLSIVSSCIAAFLINVLMHPDGRVSIHVMQHATIAGGVAMGASADMVVNPFGAMIIGFVAGTLAAVSLLYITRMLDHSARIRDTCGVLSLHGLPGIIGAVASAIAAGARKRGSYQGTMDEVFPRGYESEEQAGLQMAGLGISLGFAMLGGLIAGAVLSAMPSLPEFFDDRHEYVKDHAAGTHGTVATTNTADQAVHTVANDAPHRDQILALESAHREPMHAGTTGMTTTQTAVVPANTAVVPVSDTADVPAVRGRA